MGEDGTENPDPSNFTNKSFWQRFSVLVAGVTMNVILAWVLVSIAMGIGAPTVVDENTRLPKSAIIQPSSVGVLEVTAGSPAQLAGVKAGDLILKINGQEVASIQEVQNLTKERAGQETAYTLKRGQDTLETKMTPRANPPAGQGPLGIVPGEIAIVSYPWYEVPWRGLVSAIGLIGFTLSAFGGLIKGLFEGANVGAALSGPVGIAVLTRDVAQLGIVYLMQFTAVLSVNLAIINIVPFPALDGGRILFLVIEKLRGRKMNPKAEVWFNTIGFVLLLTLMAGVTIHDFDKFNIISRIKNLF